MTQTFRIIATVHIDVTNAESESQAREQAFAHITAVSPPKRGRTPSGPRTAVTGVTMETEDDDQKMTTGFRREPSEGVLE